MHTITFYSYKGGVGRSLALANMATKLCEFGKKVCIIDFDLEAPGIPHKFKSDFDNGAVNIGLVDYIHSYYNEGILPNTILPYSYQTETIRGGQPITIIPAGNTKSKEYWKKLSSINWFDFLYERGDGLEFLLDFKEKIRKEINPDFLLIDSRTGITEISGITLQILADELVILAVNNDENLEGVKRIVESLQNQENAIFNETPKVTFVLSRIPFSDDPDDKNKEQLLLSEVKEHFKGTIIKEINAIHVDREIEFREHIKYNFDIDTAQISKDYLILFKKITEGKLSVIEIEKFQTLALAEDLFIKAINEDNIDSKTNLINKAIALDETNWWYYYTRGDIFSSQKKWTEAINDFNKILQIHPNNELANELLGRVYYDLKEWDKSLAYFEKVLEISPENSNTYTEMALIYSAKNENELALEYLNKAIKLNPLNSIAYNNRSNCYRLNKDYEKALDDIYKSIEINSNASVSYMTLAEIHAELNHENDFYIHLENALKLCSADKHKKTSYRSNTFERIEQNLKQEDIYKRFYNEERFKRLLEKYQIVLIPDV